MSSVGSKGNIWIEFSPSAPWPRNGLEAGVGVGRKEDFGSAHWDI